MKESRKDRMQANKSRLDQKLAQLEQYIKEIKELENESKSKFQSGSAIEDAAERRVYKATQAALDLGGMVVAEYGYGAPANYRDVFAKLGENKVINKDLQNKLENMAGMRNILAHGYAKVDPEKIYEIVSKDYRDLIEFAITIKNFVE